MTCYRCCMIILENALFIFMFLFLLNNKSNMNMSNLNKVNMKNTSNMSITINNISTPNNMNTNNAATMNFSKRKMMNNGNMNSIYDRMLCLPRVQTGLYLAVYMWIKAVYVCISLLSVLNCTLQEFSFKDTQVTDSDRISRGLYRTATAAVTTIRGVRTSRVQWVPVQPQVWRRWGREGSGSRSGSGRRQWTVT